MDPLSPDSGLDGDPNDGAPALKREPGLAPAGTLMSIQIRRRMPPKNRLLGTPSPAPAPIAAAAPQAPPAPAQKLTAPSPRTAPIPLAEPKPEIAKPAAEPAAPPKPAMAKPAVAKPAVGMPTVIVPPNATPPIAAPPATAPSVAASPIATPPVAAPPVATPPVAALPVAGPSVAHRGEPGRRAPTASSPMASAPPPPAPSPPVPQPSPPPESKAPSVLNSPGIARYARTGQSERQPELKPALEIPPTGAKPPAAPELNRQTTPTPPQPEPARPEGIVSYWLRLRGNRRYPSKADLDQPRLAADWPNSILMRCRSGSKVLEPEKVFGQSKTGAPALPGGESPTAMELSPMMLQWLLTLAADAARDGRPMQDTESFPSLSKSIRYGAFALPFSDDQTRIDHVLCHVYRAP